MDPEIHLFHNEALLPQVMLSNVLSSNSEKNNPGEWHYVETERSQRIKPRASVGVGGLIRSEGGHWISSFFGHLGSMVILHAELVVLWEGLNLAWSLGFRELACFTDSLTAKLLVE